MKVFIVLFIFEYVYVDDNCFLEDFLLLILYFYNLDDVDVYLSREVGNEFSCENSDELYINEISILFIFFDEIKSRIVRLIRC